MRSWLLKTIGLCLISTICCAIAYSENLQEKHDSLKRSYFRLKNIDPQITDREAWSNVISDYQEFIQKDKNINDKILFEYASLVSEYAQATHDVNLLQEADNVYRKLIDQFPSSSLSDDAMLRRAEGLNRNQVSEDSIRQSYQEIITKYPKSDSAEIARIRLSKLLDMGSQIPSEDVANEEQDTNKIEALPKNAAINQLPVVVLDPGHGGEDFGAENDFGLLEKDVVLSIALEVERLISNKGFAEVLLTRRSDLFVPLPDRIALANSNNASLFLSLHNNASLKHNQYGITTYVLDDSSDDASKLLAERENKSAGSSASASDMDFILSDLIQSSKHPKSLLLADSIDKSVLSSIRPHWANAKSLGIKKAPFYVLVGARMPCSLIELFFIDHEVDGDRLSDPDIRKAIAAGIANGIEIFLRKNRA